MRHLLTFLVFALFLYSTPADAEPGKAAVLALVVTNNRSLDLGRPELHFADDDGAKYYDLFRGLTPEGNLRLLTDFDRDTRALFPHLEQVAQKPSKTQLFKAARELAKRAEEEHKQGHPVEFYFAFAGHGDVDEGTGFVELSDGRFNSADLEQLIGLFPGSQTHIIIDSCNSYFLINSRKPGGRRFATPEEAAQKLAKRFPNAGVFLSTSSEAEVYEWSALQSGIFSHAVRSGLSGAADVNLDGRVSYQELMGFVGVAASRVKNPLYRPKVFARGPGGTLSGVLLDLRSSESTRLEMLSSEQKRITVRDANGIPRIDAHNENGTGLTLHIPAQWLAGAEINEYRLNDSGASTLVASYALKPSDTDGTTPVASEPAVAGRTMGSASGPSTPARWALSSLPRLPSTSTGASRGSNDVFRGLFARPYGRHSLAEYEDECALEPEPVYGVTQEDLTRMKLILGQVAGQHRVGRRLAGAAFGVIGLSSIGLGAPLLLNKDRTRRDDGLVLAAMGGTALAVSGYALLFPSFAEKLASDFDRRLAAAQTPEQQAVLVADTERGLQHHASRQRTMRLTLRFGSALVAAAGISLAVVNEVVDKPTEARETTRLAASYTTGLALVTLAASFNPTPAERMVKLWESDPGRARMRSAPAAQLSFGVTPTLGGAMLGIGGAF